MALKGESQNLAAKRLWRICSSGFLRDSRQTGRASKMRFGHFASHACRRPWSALSNRRWSYRKGRDLMRGC